MSMGRRKCVLSVALSGMKSPKISLLGRDPFVKGSFLDERESKLSAISQFVVKFRTQLQVVLAFGKLLLGKVTGKKFVLYLLSKSFSPGTIEYETISHPLKTTHWEFYSRILLFV